MSEKGEVLLRGVGTLRSFCPPSASVQRQPDGSTIQPNKWFLGAGFLGAPPISLSMALASARSQSCRILSGTGALQGQFGSVRFGSVWFGKSFPIRRGSACFFGTRRDSVRSGSGSVLRPVPAGSEIERFGSVRFGWFGSVSYFLYEVCSSGP